jgi:hypothetical protein
MSHQAATTSLRRLVLVAIVLTLVQAGIGMDVNLYVTIPDDHPGALSSYFGGSVHSVGWAIAHGTPALAIHASLGLALVIVVIAVAVRAVSVADRAVIAWLILAGLLVIGAGFNGASFLDFNHDFSSLIMALLALGAIACYASALYLLPAVPRRARHGTWGASET